MPDSKKSVRHDAKILLFSGSRLHSNFTNFVDFLLFSIPKKRLYLLVAQVEIIDSIGNFVSQPQAFIAIYPNMYTQKYP